MHGTFASRATVPVTVAPFALQPDRGRHRFAVAEGATIADIVARAQQECGLPDAVRSRMIVSMSSALGSCVVYGRLWQRVRPFPGTAVTITIAPGKGALALLVQIASLAITTFFAPFLAGLSPFVKGLLGLGLTALGGLLVNALAGKPKTEKADLPTYAITGWQNQYKPDDSVPILFGKIRIAPPFGASTYLEVVGDLLYERTIFVYGPGPLIFGDHRIGDTSIDKYDELEIEVREGRSDDEPVTLYPQQVLEEKIGTNLVREFTRRDDGTMVGEGWLAPTDDNPIERYSARDSIGCNIILSFPSGLGIVDTKGKKKAVTARFRLRIKRFGTDTWIDQPDIVVTAKFFAGFYRSIPITWPTRDGWAIEIMRLTPSEEPDGNNDGSYALACTWVVLQSIRPEYPLDVQIPLALVAVRAKSTHQLNGQLDAWNSLCSREAPDWDNVARQWVARETQNPASAALFQIRGPGVAYPASDDEIDFDAFADWHEFCALKGLKCDIDVGGLKFGDALARIGAAGRASVFHDGNRWTVVVDRPREIVVDHLTTRNSAEFKASARYIDHPDAVRVKFLDATNDYKPAERVVLWPGTVGDPQVIEEIDVPGKTDPGEVYIEAARRMYELIYRNCEYSAVQFGSARVATRGDKVVASVDQLRRAIASATVLSVSGDLRVHIDETWTFEAGVQYVIRFRVFSDPEDAIGDSVVAKIAAPAGDSSSFHVLGSAVPKPGDAVTFGPLDEDVIPLIVVAVERGKDNTTVYSLADSAEIIDTLTDQVVPPAWNGRTGQEIDFHYDAPLAPRVVSISTSTGLSGEGDDGTVHVALAPGFGSPQVGSFAVDYRLAGETPFSTASAPVAQGSVDIGGYAAGDTIELRARALAPDGKSSPNTDLIPFTIYSDVPVPPPPASFTATRLPGGLWQFGWTEGTLPDGQRRDVVAGARIRYREGAWGDWDDLSPVLVGLATANPWDASTPMADGFYTFGLKLEGEDGELSRALLIYGIAPDTTAAMLTDDAGVPTTDDDGSILIEDI